MVSLRIVLYNLRMAFFDDIQFLLADITPGCCVFLHAYKPPWFTLEFLRAGRMSFRVNDGPTVLIDQPTAFWHHPDHVYTYGAVDARGWDHHYVQFRGERGRRLAEEGLANLSSTGTLPVPQPAAFGQAFESLLGLLRPRNPRNHPRAVLQLEEMFLMLQEWASAGAGSAHQAVERLAERMRNRPGQAYDLSTEAESTGLSTSHFRRLFRQAIGQPPHAYLIACRIQAAAELLARSDRQVKDIAAAVGYPDVPQFSKLFRRKIGLSPHHYRQALPTTRRSAARGPE